jgi:hypothetical protein
MKKVVNLTPHPVEIVTLEDSIHLPASSKPARAEMNSTALAPVELSGMTVPVLHEQVVRVTDLPKPAKDTLFVVSRLVAEAVPHRDDLVVPTQLTRNTDGTVGAARALAKVGPLADLAVDGEPPVPPGSLVVLCGSQPLPIFLSIATRRPPFVVLVHSKQTAEQARRVQTLLRSMTEPIESTLLLVPDAGNGPAMRAPLLQLGREWELDYTGGTKAMAAHARLALTEVRPDADSVASYVDHAAAALRFDDARRLSLRSSGLTLARMAELHGGRLEGGSRVQPPAEWLHTEAGRLFEALRTARNLTERATRAANHVARLKALGTSEAWRREISQRPGLWLEWFVEERVRAALAKTPSAQLEVQVGLDLYPAGALDNAELDVVVRLGWRVRLLSCDTSRPAMRWSAEHKKKAMEAQARVRQLAGDASRGALVTLLEPDGVAAIEHHLTPVELGAPARVFGRLHLERWLDDDLFDLQEWCTR